jgi:hypothetical protein
VRKSFFIFASGFAGGFLMSRTTFAPESRPVPLASTNACRAQPRRTRKDFSQLRAQSFSAPSTATTPEIMPTQAPQVSSSVANTEADWLPGGPEECRDLLMNDNDQQAIDCAQKCLDQNPSESRCRSTLIWAYNKVGESEKAMFHINDCLRENSDSSVCLSPNDLERVSQGDLDDAQGFVDRLSTVSSRSSWTQYAEAILEERLGNHEVAQNLYKEACSKGRRTACSFVDPEPESDDGTVTE